jgi:hypothetical protein
LRTSAPGLACQAFEGGISGFTEGQHHPRRGEPSPHGGDPVVDDMHVGAVERDGLRAHVDDAPAPDQDLRHANPSRSLYSFL